MSKLLPTVTAFLMFFGATAAPAIAQAPQGEDAAMTEAAVEWLGLIDSGEFEQSWSELAPTFQSAMSSAEWTSTMRDVARMTGTLVSREFSETAPSDAPSGSRAAGYRFVHFVSTFQNVPQVMERVVMEETADEGWKVAGYFLMPVQGAGPGSASLR